MAPAGPAPIMAIEGGGVSGLAGGGGAMSGIVGWGGGGGGCLCCRVVVKLSWMASDGWKYLKVGFQGREEHDVGVYKSS